MRAAHRRSSRMIDQGRIQTLLRVCTSLLILAGITLFYRHIAEVNSTTIALTFLLAILGIALGHPPDHMWTIGPLVLGNIDHAIHGIVGVGFLAGGLLSKNP